MAEPEKKLTLKSVTAKLNNLKQWEIEIVGSSLEPLTRREFNLLGRALSVAFRNHWLSYRTQANLKKKETVKNG